MMFYWRLILLDPRKEEDNKPFTELLGKAREDYLQARFIKIVKELK